jgi:hypothetical protein
MLRPYKREERWRGKLAATKGEERCRQGCRRSSEGTIYRAPTPDLGVDECEFDAFAHGVDAFGADADFVAEMPFEGAGFCAAA